jgi:Transposase
VTNGMRWVGIDLHRRRSQIAVVDEHGELSLSRRIVNDRETFLELLGEPGGETHVALEATYRWEWLAELLEDAGYDLHLAHRLRTRAIAAARVKTDAIDARTLAQLLRAGLLPEAYLSARGAPARIRAGFAASRSARHHRARGCDRPAPATCRGRPRRRPVPRRECSHRRTPLGARIDAAPHHSIARSSNRSSL